MPTEGTPDRIAYVQKYQDIVNLKMLDTNGITLSHLATTNGDDEDPAFSLTKIEDVPYVAFTSDEDGDDKIFVVSITSDMDTPLQRTHNDATDQDPSLGPDGRIVFASDRGGNMDIWVMNFEGSNAVQLTTDPAFSPDGTTILFESERTGGEKDIWIMDADGGNQTALTTDPAKDCDPAWSQDGARVAFCSNRHGTDDLFMMNPDGSEQVRLTDWDSEESDPTWSPDGGMIAFETDHTGDWEIYILELGEPNTFSNFTDRPAHDDWDPAWSPELF